MGPLGRLSAAARRTLDEASGRVADWIRGEQKIAGRMFVDGRMDVSDVPIHELRPSWHHYSPLQLMQRLEHTAQSAPGTFEYFDPMAILNVLGRDRAAVMDPADFERVAWSLQDRPNEWKMRRLREYLDSVPEGLPAELRELPYLEMRPTYHGDRGWPGLECTGHEGRHRCRTLVDEGVDAVLTRLEPTSGPGEFRNWDVGRDQATAGGLLRRLLSGKVMIAPEPEYESHPRPLVRSGRVFKDVFAAGGRV